MDMKETKLVEVTMPFDECDVHFCRENSTAWNWECCHYLFGTDGYGAMMDRMREWHCTDGFISAYFRAIAVARAGMVLFHFECRDVLLEIP